MAGRLRVMTLAQTAVPPGKVATVATVAERIRHLTAAAPEDEDVAVRTKKGKEKAETTLDEWLGVSAGFLVKLRGELVEYDFGKPLDEVTTSECCELFIKHMSTNGPYCTSLPDPPARALAHATHFVSHAWKYKLLDVLDLLIQHGEDTEGEQYYWFDILLVDQNKAPTLDKSFWTDTFKEAICSIGHTLLILAPWNDPIPLTRAWCLFEIYSTMANSKAGVRLSILLPDSERAALRRAVVSRPTVLTEALVAVQAEKAEAYLPEDRLMIFAAIDEMDGGFHALNVNVKRMLRDWVLNCVSEMARQDEGVLTPTTEADFAHFADHVGQVFEANGKHAEALALHRKSLAIREAAAAAGEQALLDIAATQCLIGNALRGSASYEAALIEYREALRIQEAELGVGHPSTAACYHNIGVVLKRKAMDESMEDDGGMAGSGFSAALDSLQKSLTIKMDSMDEYDSSIARTREAIGKLLAKMGDLDGATIQLQGCLAIQRATIGENHPDTAACYNVIGEVLQKKGDPEGALSMLRRSLTIREAVFGKDHPRTANTRTNVAISLCSMGKYDAALAAHRECLVVRTAKLGPDHPYVAKTSGYIADTLRLKAKAEAAGTTDAS